MVIGGFLAVDHFVFAWLAFHGMKACEIPFNWQEIDSLMYVSLFDVSIQYAVAAAVV